MRYPLLRYVVFLSFVVVANIAFAQLRTVAVTGGSAPDTANLFSFLDAPVLNNSGEVAFEAFLDDNDGSQGIWSEGDGIGLMRKIALVGDLAPDTGGRTFGEFEDTARFLHLNDLGDVAFLASLDDFSKVIYTDRERPATTLTKIAHVGDTADDTAAGRRYNSGFVLDGFGGIHSGTAFRAFLTPGDPPNNFPSEAAYSEGFSVVLENVAEVGEPAPGSVRPAVGGGPALFSQTFSPTINDAGHVAFSAATNAGTGAGSIGAGGVWSTSPGGTLRGVALAGQSAPGTTTTFSQFFGRISPASQTTPVINNSGDIAFTATLVGLIDGGLRVGVWVERNQVVEKVAFESESAPGTSSTFSRIGDPLIDGDGKVAFVAELADGRDGVWTDSGSMGLMPIVLEGDSAPGTSLEFLNILDMAYNTSGQAAFLAQLSDISSDGLFATDPAGTLRKIVASGDLIDADGTLFSVEFVEFLGLNGGIDATGNGVTNGLNDLGQVAFKAEGEILDEFMAPTGQFLEALFVSDLATTSILFGDFNNDHVVDAADYTVWRDNLGAADESSLMGNGDGINGVDAGDYDVWKSNFGATSPVLSHVAQTSISVAVPEPATSSLLTIAAALAVIAARQHRAARSGH